MVLLPSPLSLSFFPPWEEGAVEVACLGTWRKLGTLGRLSRLGTLGRLGKLGALGRLLGCTSQR